MAYYINYSKRLKVEIDSTYIDSNLSDFTVKVTDDMCYIPEDFWDSVKSDGSDIVVTSDDGETKLKRDLIEIDTTNKILELNFKATTLSSSATSTFYIYYGYASGAETNDTDTYDSNYHLVFPMNDKSGDNSKIVDRTSSAEGSKGSANNPDETTGLITGKAQNFDAGTETINLGNDNFDEITVTMVVRCNYGYSYRGIIEKEDAFHMYYYQLGTGEWSWRGKVWNEDGDDVLNHTGADSIIIGDRKHIGIKYNQTTGTAYYLKDGVWTSLGDMTNGKTLAQNSNNILLGFNSVYQSGLQDIDELRISDTPRSDEWVKAEYYNLIKNWDFMTITPEKDATTTTKTWGERGTEDYDDAGGYPSKDTSLQAGSQANTSFGDDDDLQLKTYNTGLTAVGLMRFPLTPLSGAGVVSSDINWASLKLVVSNALFEKDVTLKCYLLDTDFGKTKTDEGGSSNPAATNEACWNKSFYNTVNWGGGSNFTVAADCSTLFDSKIQHVNDTPEGTEIILDVTGYIKYVLDNSDSDNFGIVLLFETATSGTVYCYFYTQDEATAAKRPELTVNYSEAGGTIPVFMANYRRRMVQ